MSYQNYLRPTNHKTGSCNADETGLYYRTLSGGTIIQKTQQISAVKWQKTYYGDGGLQYDWYRLTTPTSNW